MTSRCDATTRTMPGAAVIELSGEVDGTAADVLTAAYQAAVTGTDVGVVVLDFASVVYINSTGIALIVSVLARAKPQRKKLDANGLTAHYREIFELTRLDEAITIYDSEESALVGAAK